MFFATLSVLLVHAHALQQDRDGSTVEVNGVQIPGMLFGTAWKKDATYDQTIRALEMGYRGIDSANQPLHYNEPATGRAVGDFMKTHSIARGALFLQSKFTHVAHHGTGQPPYDVDSNVREQVRQSFQSSLDHFSTDFLDAYLVHGPSTDGELGSVDLEAWRALEKLFEEKTVKLIGFGNIKASQLEELVAFAKIKPHFVQQRLIGKDHWSRELSQVCEKHGILYQAYSVVASNRHILGNQVVTGLALSYSIRPAQVLHKFVLQRGHVVITGTTDEEQLEENLNSLYAEDFTEDTMQRIELIGTVATDMDDSTRIKVKVINDEPYEVEAFWLKGGPGGEPIHQFVLAPNSEHIQFDTYNTHVFEFKHDEGTAGFWFANRRFGDEQKVYISSLLSHDEL
mmetsp:Transcript_3134/g.4505  ORF Transcript_3134/g.4505 Transcript_3134/m.4505 type:complete len:398 (+) Transcript_3134:665-1858(+)